jgi:hypothetical protein
VTAGPLSKARAETQPEAAAAPSASEIEALFELARRRRRRRRRLTAGLAGLALAASLTGAWAARPGHAGQPAHRSDRDHPAAVTAAGFALPAARVAWVDYNGGLHIGDVATLAQHVVARIPGWAGLGWLYQADGQIYGADWPVIREFDPATGRIRTVARGVNFFASANGRNTYLALTGTRLMELRASGHGVLRQLRVPAGWNVSGDVDGAIAGGSFLVSADAHGAGTGPSAIGVWNAHTGHVRVLAYGYLAAGPVTPPDAHYSLIAWQRCALRSCPLEITSIPSLRTVTVRSPLRHGFASGTTFSPDGTRLAVFERTASLNSSCCANSSMVAIVSTRTGAVRPVRGARLETQEDAGWILWLPGGNRLLAGALLDSYAVDTQIYKARPFFFYPQTAEGPNADHNIMDTPDINFSAVLLPRA